MIPKEAQACVQLSREVSSLDIMLAKPTAGAGSLQLRQVDNHARFQMPILGPQDAEMHPAQVVSQ